MKKERENLRCEKPLEVVKSVQIKSKERVVELKKQALRDIEKETIKKERESKTLKNKSMYGIFADKKYSLKDILQDLKKERNESDRF